MKSLDEGSLIALKRALVSLNTPYRFPANYHSSVKANSALMNRWMLLLPFLSIFNK